ncbi:MAG: group II intron reverse transcriptase/maturase [Bryobacteraceae bacterium]|nr:group II intron reverse transcriptase/maturase [Bryobacteraceae bacterium]
MNVAEESDFGVVPLNQPNQGGRPPAEVGEGRPEIKENIAPSRTRPTQSGVSVSQGLCGVRQRAKERKEEKFTALLHHLTFKLLRESYFALQRKAAPGVDGERWQQYGTGLEDRLADLHSRVHRGAYRAKPSRRVYIPKADGRQRPLGIAALEDKIVQQAVVTILNQIYEVDFQGFSYGFRPGRSPHQALDALYVGLVRSKVNWVLDADLRSFFDQMQHEWIMQFVQHRVADPRILRLIQKWLKAGVQEDGEWEETELGTPQGAVISPLLANVYLHYVFDLWVAAWREKAACGQVVVVRYADDLVVGFESKADALRFLEQFRARLAKFGLELHPEKTRLLEFGRFAAVDRRERGEKKPETFTFLGFVHQCGTSPRGLFVVWRQTANQRMVAKLKLIKQQLRRRMHEPLEQVGKWLQSVAQGYYQYHAVPGNLRAVNTFRHRLRRLWRSTLRHRSQRPNVGWNRIGPLFDRWLPAPRVLHPYPDARFDARHPR